MKQDYSQNLERSLKEAAFKKKTNEIFFSYRKKIDSGVGIGGLSVGQDEYASDCFDLFKDVEIENSIEEVTKVITQPISAVNSRGPFIF